MWYLIRFDVSVLFLADVVNLVKKYLDRCIMHGALNLAHLGRIENKLLEEFNFPNFHTMGQGHFIDFLLASDEIKQVTMLLICCIFNTLKEVSEIIQ